MSKTPGNTVSNLSSTRALADVTNYHNGNYFASAVGEVNVVEKMKEINAVIGGEGNGGIILKEVHLGRDSLVGVSMILNLLSKDNKSIDEIEKNYKSLIPSERFALPEEIASSVSFLCSNEASYINGINLPIDGGYSSSL